MLTFPKTEISNRQTNKSKQTKNTTKGFPGGPVVKTPRFHCRGLGSSPPPPPAVDRGTKIPRAAQRGQKKSLKKYNQNFRSAFLKFSFPLFAFSRSKGRGLGKEGRGRRKERGRGSLGPGGEPLVLLVVLGPAGGHPQGAGTSKPAGAAWEGPRCRAAPGPDPGPTFTAVMETATTAIILGGGRGRSKEALCVALVLRYLFNPHTIPARWVDLTPVYRD